MPAITKIIKRGLSSSSLMGKNSKQGANEPGKSLSSDSSSSELKFTDFYKIQKRLSKGSFGVVYVTLHIPSGTEFAVKVIDRVKLTDKERCGVEREVAILKDLRRVPNIVQLVDFFTAPDHFYVVQNYAQGGDVFERLAQRTSYTEADARNLARHLLQAIEVLHARRLAHRDLKPENLLLKDLLDDTQIVVADFGFASYVPPEGLKTRCGTPAFVAPEVLVPNCRYDERVDNWSVGCLLYMLIAGYPPFQDRNHRGLFKKVRGADFVFHDVYWKNVSVPAKQLISSLLTVDPSYRATARTALDTSSWLKMDDALLKGHDLSASLGEIKKFHARRSLKGAMHAVVFSVKHKFKSAGDAEFPPDLEFEKAGTAANLNEAAAGGGDLRAMSELGLHSRDPIAKEASDSVLLTTLRPTVSFEDVYDTGELLHNGQAVKVYECVHRLTRKVFAVKVIDRNETSRKSVTGKTMSETVLHEVAILDSLQHDTVIRINEFFEDDEQFYLVMERMRGGDVFDRMLRLKKYNEENARLLAQNLLEALDYFHGQGVAHRDLKPQNLLLKSPESDTDIVISDFGFATRVRGPQSLTTRCGTPSYVAPEVLKNVPYDQSADLWSVGVILYIIICGYPPFVDENQSELFRKIRMGEWKFGEDWDAVSNEPKELIRGLLVANSGQRLTAKQALQCSWLRGACDEYVETVLGASELGAQKAEALHQRKSKLVTAAKGDKNVAGESSPVKQQNDLVSEPDSDAEADAHLRQFEC